LTETIPIDALKLYGMLTNAGFCFGIFLSSILSAFFIPSPDAGH
jgi:hypothetical protein